MKFALALIAALAAIVAPALSGRTYNRCSLAQELARHGVPRNELAIWTCIAEHESSYRTWVVGPTNSDGSNDYGIFQINNRYWCQPPNGRYSANLCRINCNDLLTDDISNSLRCAQQIKRETGWGAWTVWYKCRGWLPSINNCF